MDNAVESSYMGYEKTESKDDTIEYYSSEVNNYVVIKNNKDKSIVLVSYEDNDLLWKMVDSIKFKSSYSFKKMKYRFKGYFKISKTF